MSEQLQRQVQDRELDAALVLAPQRLPGLTYTHVLDEPLAVWMHAGHPLATRPELALADLDDQAITLARRTGWRGSGFNAAIRELFAGTGLAPRFDETPQVYPPNAAIAPGFLCVSVRVDYPDGVVRVPLVPRRTLPFEFVQRGADEPLRGPRLRALRGRVPLAGAMRGRHATPAIGIGSVCRRRLASRA